MRQAIVRFEIHSVGQQRVFNDETKLADFIAALTANQCSFSVEFLMLTNMEATQLQRYRHYYGDMSVEECLECAVNDEEILNSLSAYDTKTKIHFYHSMESMLRYAGLLEKENSK